MALEPIVKFFDTTNNIEFTNLTADPSNPSPVKWGVGTVKAGEISSLLTLRVWNNKGGAELCSNMQDCSLIVLDSNGAQSEPIVTEGWLVGKCTSLDQTSFSALSNATGGTTEFGDPKVSGLSIGADGLTDYQISGAINGGLETDMVNFSDIELKFKIPNNSVHGTKNFSVAVRYFFV